MKVHGVLLLFFMVFFMSCKKNEPPIYTSIIVEVEHMANSKLLVFDTLNYKNLAGNTFSVTRLEYYLSDFKFNSNQNNFIHPKIQYINALNNHTTQFILDSIPVGNLSDISFLIGLAPQKNIFGHLPNTIDNNKMFWPEQMGEGYHFMKFEGRFVHGAQYGSFAFHIGKNGYQVTQKFSLQKQLTQQPYYLKLTMNVDNWFEQPHTYNLLTDDTYTMGNDHWMNILVKNGSNVFSLKLEP